MRPRTPNIIWIPFLFSLGGLSWVLLVGALGIFAVATLTPAYQEMRVAQAQRNDVQATVELLDKKIALQDEFLQVATKDPLVMQRLASRQFHLNLPQQEVLPLDGDAMGRDRSITSLIAESLPKVKPQPLAVEPKMVTMLTNQAVRPVLLVLACGALFLSFVLGVRYTRG